MKYHLIILFFNESDSQLGTISWTGKWYNQIVSVFPVLKTIAITQIESTTGISATKTGDSSAALSLQIKDIERGQERLALKFEIGSPLVSTSGSLRKRLWAILKDSGTLNNSKFLPLCCLLTSEQGQNLLSSPIRSQNPINKTLSDELKVLEQANDWLAIHFKFSPVDSLPTRNPEIWNDSDLLNKIGFALGKLAETSGIPRNIFKDEVEKKKFLKQQTKYRADTEMIRKRCIELFPNNPSYHSTLGYLHYQNVHELTQPKGRRDGNIREEIEKAIECFDNSLKLDPSRISDIYRKGYLLSEVLPKQILFGRAYSDIEDRPSKAKDMIQQGIRCFKNVEGIWESYNLALEKEQALKKKHQKDYVKSLYHTGCSFYELIINDWDEVLLALRLQDGLALKDKNVSNPNQFDLQNADNAWTYFSKCWQNDLPESARGQPFDSKQQFSGTIEGVFKLYWLGKVSFARYWILSSAGLHDTTEALKQRSTAEKYLTAALDTPWTSENQRQKRDFVAELLARLYITTGDCVKAIETINRHRSSRFLDPFVANTLSLALQLLGRFKEATQVLTDAIENHSNKAVWISSFLLGCASLNEGNLDKARVQFQNTTDLAKKHGNNSLDSALIGLAFVSYKSEDIPNALRFLEEAIKLNPYRVACQLRLEQWKQSFITPNPHPTT